MLPIPPSYASLASLLGLPGTPFHASPLLSVKPLYYEDRESLIFGETHYIRSLLSEREEIYDLRLDPQEQHDLSRTSPGRLFEARESMQEQRHSSDLLRESYGIREPSFSEPNRETLERLRCAIAAGRIDRIFGRHTWPPAWR